MRKHRMNVQCYGYFYQGRFGDTKIVIITHQQSIYSNIVNVFSNNLRKSGFVLHGEEDDEKDDISWEYVKKGVQSDLKRCVRLMPRVHEIHLALPAFKVMRVNLAAQILSASVASGLKQMVENGTLPGDAMHTAQFVENIDILFDIFNGRGLKICWKVASE